MEIDYEVSGSLTVENVNPTQSDLVVDTVRQAISQQTGVPVSDIEVQYDSDTGKLDYKLKSDSYNESTALKTSIDNDSFTNAIESSLETIDGNIDVTSPEVSDAILADISLLVDTENATVDMKNATTKLKADLSTDGFTIDKADGIFLI